MTRLLLCFAPLLLLAASGTCNQSGAPPPTPVPAQSDAAAPLAPVDAMSCQVLVEGASVTLACDVAVALQAPLASAFGCATIPPQAGDLAAPMACVLAEPWAAQVRAAVAPAAARKRR